MRRDVFQAIADPTRRDIMTLIARSPLTPNHVADRFPVSRQAVSKHLKILQECGLITVTRQGRERYCHVQPARLNEVSDWLDAFRRSWEERFSRLDQLLAEMEDPANPPHTSPR